MGKVAFTICSNNYLAQAKTLGDSVLKYNPDYKFIIVLCDKKNKSVDYDKFSKFEILEAHKLEFEEFENMCSQYNIVELNTSIKPFVFKYIYKNFGSDIVIYLDPDTAAFKSFECIETELADSSILLTPHIYRPIEIDEKSPSENTFTNFGIYNLGFLATKQSKDTEEMLNWWCRRMAKNCYIKPESGVFVDQLPMNFAPLFFNNVKITLNEGLNAAPWNLQERAITFDGNKYLANNYDLVLYHFSNYNPFEPDILAKNYTRITFENHHALKQLYDNYGKELISNEYKKYKTIKCFYSSELANWNAKKRKYNLGRYMIRHPLFMFRREFYRMLLCD